VNQNGCDGIYAKLSAASREAITLLARHDPQLSSSEQEALTEKMVEGVCSGPCHPEYGDFNSPNVPKELLAPWAAVDVFLFALLALDPTTPEPNVELPLFKVG